MGARYPQPETDPVAEPDLAAHEAQTTDVHGIADTAALATATDVGEVQGALDTHEASTSDVHGIDDTSRLLVGDVTGAVPDGRRVKGSLNRPRVLPPSFGAALTSPQAWQRVKAGIIKPDQPWKSMWSGYGNDLVWDPESRRLVLIYGGHDGTHAQVGIAYTDDGVAMSDYAGNPVFPVNPAPGQQDSGGVVSLLVTWKDGVWYGYYIGFPNTGIEQGTPAVMLATATSLKGPWTRQGAKVTKDSFPVPAGDSAVGVLYRPTILEVGDWFYMFINAGPQPGDEDMWVFRAPAIDGPWTVVGDGPIISGDLFGGTIFSDPEVLRYGDEFLMIGWSSGGGHGGTHLCRCDASEFPTTWHIDDVNPFFNPPGSSYRPCWVELPGGPALYINGNNGAQVDLWVPVSANPPGVQPGKWHDYISFAQPPLASIGMWLKSQISALWDGFELINTPTHAQGDSVTVMADLSAGTWSLSLGYGAFNGGGKVTLDYSWDGTNWTTIGTVDTYDPSATALPKRAEFTGIDVKHTGPHRFRATVSGKNASSSNFYASLCNASFARTA